MTQKIKARSRIFEAVHDTASDLHRLGFIDKRKMRKFDALYLDPVPEYDSEQIRALRDQGERPRVFWIRCERPSMPARMSMGSTTSQTWEAVGIMAGASATRPTRARLPPVVRCASHRGCGVG